MEDVIKKLRENIGREYQLGNEKYKIIDVELVKDPSNGNKDLSYKVKCLNNPVYKMVQSHQLVSVVNDLLVN